MTELTQQDLYVSGESGYARYRIPALLTTASGTILAFAEARKFTGGDSDQIDLFLRRSTDGGKTFGDVQVVATTPDWVCGNPAPVQDRESGRIWLLFCKNRKDGDEGMICEGKAPREVWKCYSDDDGASWSKPEEITASVKPPEWSWYATGPCHGIQLASGRLVVPCDHIVFKDYNRGDPYYSHVIYSDDSGETWRVGGSASEGTNESTIEEIEAGLLYFNCRNKYRLDDGGNFRGIAFSTDGGETFTPIVHDAGLPEPICQGSVLAFRRAGEPAIAGRAGRAAAGEAGAAGTGTGESPDAADTSGDRRLLFSNPAARSGVCRGRHSLTVKLSYDGGVTWPVSRVLHEGPAAYSDLCVAPDGSIVCFYERGDDGPYERMTVARFGLDWLEAGNG